MQIEMEDLTEPGDSREPTTFKRTQETVRSADSGIGTIPGSSIKRPVDTAVSADSGINSEITTGTISAANQVPGPSGHVLAEAVPEPSVDGIVSRESTGDEISKLTKNNKERTREIDASNRVKEYRTVSLKFIFEISTDPRRSYFETDLSADKSKESKKVRTTFIKLW